MTVNLTAPRANPARSASLLARADAIFIDELRQSGWYDKTSQAFAVFLPVTSVGVVGDARAYEWVIPSVPSSPETALALNHL